MMFNIGDKVIVNNNVFSPELVGKIGIILKIRYYSGGVDQDIYDQNVYDVRFSEKAAELGFDEFGGEQDQDEYTIDLLGFKLDLYEEKLNTQEERGGLKFI